MSNDTLELTKKVVRLLDADQACKGQANHARVLLDKLEQENMTISVIGQFKRGKSTLANAILEDDVLPVGIIPITSAVTRVHYGEKSAAVHFQNGKVEEIPFERLSEFISEQENSNNKLGVEAVVIHTPSEFLKNNLTFVDTPGVGSFHKNNTEVAYHYMKESDAVIFLLSVDSPINQIEIDFLQSTKQFASEFYYVINKTDVVSEDDLISYTDYCSKLLKQIMGTDSIRMFPVSSKTGRGIEELKAAILLDCKTLTPVILEESTRKKLKDVINNSLTQLDFYWKAMNMAYEELDERFESISQTIAEIKSEAEECQVGFELKINEIKLKLSEKVLELFGMEYHYDIEEISSGIFAMEKDEFIKNVDMVCQDLNATLNQVLLYREENAYTVIRRINNINKLTKELRRIKDKL